MREAIVHLLQRVNDELTGVRSVFVTASSRFSRSSSFSQNSTRPVSRLSLTMISRS